jgi:RNA 2',3'-cyclic 3'-phosphodiesterase
MSRRATVGGDDRLRLFCGFALPEAALDVLERWQARELDQRGGRVVPRGNLHVTLAFLGSRPSQEVEAVAHALRAAAEGGGSPVFRALRYRETRSVGMLVLEDEDGRGTRLADRLHDRLVELGVYRREQRPWLPHVTVLRFRERPRLHPAVPDLGSFSPSDAAVYHSALRPGGAQYSVLESVALGG